MEHRAHTYTRAHILPFAYSSAIGKFAFMASSWFSRELSLSQQLKWALNCPHEVLFHEGTPAHARRSMLRTHSPSCASGKAPLPQLAYRKRWTLASIIKMQELTLQNKVFAPFDQPSTWPPWGREQARNQEGRRPASCVSSTKPLGTFILATTSWSRSLA